MPIASSSRYFGLPVVETANAAGAVHPTIAMRLGPGPTTATLYQRTLTAPETLEYLAWRRYRSSEAWWRIADANPLVFPLDWRPGESVTMSVGVDRGQVQRTRKF